MISSLYELGVVWGIYSKTLIISTINLPISLKWCWTLSILFYICSYIHELFFFFNKSIGVYSEFLGMFPLNYFVYIHIISYPINTFLVVKALFFRFFPSLLLFVSNIHQLNKRYNVSYKMC